MYDNNSIDNVLWTLEKLFGSVWFISSMAGLAVLLESGKKLTWRNIISALIYSGVMGTIVGLLMYERYQGSPELLIGVSALAGIGGASVLDIVKQFIANKLGINIEVSVNKK